MDYKVYNAKNSSPPSLTISPAVMCYSFESNGSAFYCALVLMEKGLFQRPAACPHCPPPRLQVLLGITHVHKASSATIGSNSSWVKFNQDESGETCITFL